MCYSLYHIYDFNYQLTARHIITLVLILAFAIVYFIKEKIAIFLLGIILVLSTFSVILLKTTGDGTSYFVKFFGLKLRTPIVDKYAFSLLSFYVICHYQMLKKLYIDYKNS